MEEWPPNWVEDQFIRIYFGAESQILAIYFKISWFYLDIYPKQYSTDLINVFQNITEIVTIRRKLKKETKKKKWKRYLEDL